MDDLEKGTYENGELRCPLGHAGPFRYLEDIVVWRDVKDAHEEREAVLAIDGFYQSGEGYDYGENPRLECRSTEGDAYLCLTEFLIPEELTLEFI